MTPKPEPKPLCVDGVRVAYPLFQAGDGGSIPTSALQLTITEIGMRRAQVLNQLWHSILPVTHLGNLVGNRHCVAYVAEYEGVFYATAIWTTPIAANRLRNGWSALELRRFAIASDAPPNTASRMLAVMRRLIQRRFPDVDRLISYQAVAHHHGIIYRAAGWTMTSRCDDSVWHGQEHRAAKQITSGKLRWEYKLHDPVSANQHENRQDTQSVQLSFTKPLCPECAEWPCICRPKDVYIIGKAGGDNGGA